MRLSTSCSQPPSQPPCPPPGGAAVRGEGGVERGGVRSTQGAGYGSRDVFPLIQSLEEALSTPLPPPPAFRSLHLHPSSLASAGCKPHSPVSSISPYPGSPAVLHPHLVNSSTPPSYPSSEPAPCPRTSRPRPSPPRALPRTPSPQASHPPLFRSPIPIFAWALNGLLFLPHESSRRPLSHFTLTL